MGKLFNVVAGASLGLIGIVTAVPTCGGGAILASMAAGSILGSSIADSDKKANFEAGAERTKKIAQEEIKKYSDFYLATTALSYYCARCDGNISEAEKIELEHDLSALRKNAELPAEVNNEMVRIQNDTHLSWNTVKKYLDEVDVITLKKLSKDVEEIIQADGVPNMQERKTKELFDSYVKERENNE